jgi:hypothetical protein
MSSADETWSVGEAKIQGNPVVYKFINELPSANIRQSMPWLTIVAWKYDGTGNNGMPPKHINESMIKLEDGLELIEGRGALYLDVATETGNNSKEFMFYIADRDKFMTNFNIALKRHSAYPIKITFYEDKEWSELKKLHKDFRIKY